MSQVMSASVPGEHMFRCIFGMLCIGYSLPIFCKREVATACGKYCTSSHRICRFVHVRSLFAKHKVGWTTSEPRLRGQTWLEEAHPSPNLFTCEGEIWTRTNRNWHTGVWSDRPSTWCPRESELSRFYSSAHCAVLWGRKKKCVARWQLN